MAGKSFLMLVTAVFLGSLLLITSCSGGSTGSGDGSAEDDSTSTSDDTTPPGDDSSGDDDSAPTISGFDFSLREGDYWEFEWDYHRNSWAQGSGSSTTNRAGRFRVTLGPSTLIGGIEAFEVKVSGRSKVVGTSTTDFAPRWKYIAIADNKILGGESPTQLETIFDAQTGVWAGGGFFTELPSSTLISASPGQVSNDYLTESGYRVQRSSSQSQCEYFPSVGTICGDSSFSYTEREFYKPSVGPLAYYYYNSFSDCGGGFCSGATREYNVGLVASSHRGDVLTYDLEVESNNALADASVIDISRDLRGDLVDEDDNGATTTVTLSSTAEGSNSSSAGAQAISLPTRIVGSVHSSDPGENLTISNFPGAGQNYDEKIEDWYYFTLSQTRTWKFQLDFSGDGTADLDMFVIQDTVNFPLMDSAINDNPSSGNPTESMTVSLTAGSYWLAVDGFATPAGSVSYTLDVDTSSNPTNSAEILDWLTFTLNSQASLDIQGVGGPTLMLIDSSGSNILQSDTASTSAETTSIVTGLLAPGDYFLGLARSGNSLDEYQVSITVQ